VDTHTLLWSITDSSRISRYAAQQIKDPENDIFVSTISFWEVSLKSSIGKIEIVGFSPEELPSLVKKQDFTIIYPNETETATFHLLPVKTKHKDPFDRFLIWQSISRRAAMISCDRDFHQYEDDGLKLIW
jgi:PIN domain nuclease of toxin-antitoxin system